MSSAHAAFSAMRPHLSAEVVKSGAARRDGVLCSLCARPGVVACMDCISLGQTILCVQCDEMHHKRAHFHRREVWSGGYNKRIPPHMLHDQEGELVEKCMHKLIDKLIDKCPAWDV